MTEATKDTLKKLVLPLAGIGVFALVAFFVPDESLFKIIFKYFMLVVLVAGMLYFTGVLNKIISYFKKK
jgi:Na+/serine symporter